MRFSRTASSACSHGHTSGTKRTHRTIQDHKRVYAVNARVNLALHVIRCRCIYPVCYVHTDYASASPRMNIVQANSVLSRLHALLLSVLLHALVFQLVDHTCTTDSFLCLGFHSTVCSFMGVFWALIILFVLAALARQKSRKECSARQQTRED